MSANIYRDFNSVTTILAIENQLTASLGIKMNCSPSTTLNSKLGILADVVPEVVPRIRYFGIGINGYANLTSENNIAQPFMPLATQFDLLEGIPFRCVTEPLQGEEAKQYAMRDKVVIDGTTYYRYWLKKIEFESSTVRLTKVVDKVEEQYTLDSANLYPTPSDLFPTDVSAVKDRIVASVTGICRVTGAEVTDITLAVAYFKLYSLTCLLGFHFPEPEFIKSVRKLFSLIYKSFLKTLLRIYFRLDCFYLCI